MRIPVKDYKFSRNDRRTLRKNSDIRIQQLDNKFVEEHFDLYQRYINSRHIGGSMENPTRSDYHRFLICDWTDTSFIEFRSHDKLLAIAVTDTTSTGHSAVYTFFDPEESDRSLGHFSIMTQIRLTQESALPYLYLGYWIKNCQKMAYKSRYKPAEGFINDEWVELD